MNKLALSSVFLSTLVLVGCGGGPSPVEVNGKVVLPAGIKLEKDDSFSITLSPTEGDKGGAVSDVSKESLTFEIKKAVPGKYKVAIDLTPYPNPGYEKRKGAIEALTSKFNLRQTTLTYEVTADAKQSITVDLAKGTVSKN